MSGAFFCNMRKAIRSACLCLFATATLRAQNTNVATTTVNDSSILLTLQTPGNIDRVSLDAAGMTAAELKRHAGLYITYDPMNPGEAVDYSVGAGRPLVLSFPAKYGAFVKLVFRGRAIHRGIR